jgi:hypothetical protein
MQTKAHEISDHIYRLSTFVPDVAPGGFTFNQFLVDADDPLCSTRVRDGCFRSFRMRLPALFPCIGFGGLPSATWRPTSVEQ